jgi:hypothetical protein
MFPGRTAEVKSAHVLYPCIICSCQQHAPMYPMVQVLMLTDAVCCCGAAGE